jgi:hypothetical protein
MFFVPTLQRRNDIIFQNKTLIETFAQLHETGNYVLPAKAGIQYYQALPGFRPSPE